MSKKQMPIESDSDFIKNLKKGDKLYTTEYFSAANEVVVNEFTFEQWSKKVTLKEDDDARFADLKFADSSIKANVDVAYGFFKTPLDALEAFESEIEKIHKAATKGINKELRRLEKCAAKLRKMQKEGVKNDL